MPPQPVKVLLVCVGERPEAAAERVNRLRPEGLCFFAAERDKGLIDGRVLPKIQQPPRQWDQILTPDGDDLDACCRALAGRLSGLMAQWEAEPSQVVVDVSGGGRTMACALALCAAEHASRYVVAGGEDAKEVNLWDALAGRALKEAAADFNRGRYGQAAAGFAGIGRKVSGGAKPLYKALAGLAEGYALWDAFDYRAARGRLQESKKALEMAALFGGPPGMKGLLSAVGENLAFLEKIVMGAQGPKAELFLDLLAGARRRAKLERRYDDAAVRLFRALGVLAQVRLDRRGIRMTAADPEKIPESLRGSLRGRGEGPDGKVRLSLPDALRVLSALGEDPDGAFEKHAEGLKVLLEAREQGVLAQGFEPIKPEWYERCWELALKISGTEAKALPRFPKMEF